MAKGEVLLYALTALVAASIILVVASAGPSDRKYNGPPGVCEHRKWGHCTGYWN